MKKQKNAADVPQRGKIGGVLMVLNGILCVLLKQRKDLPSSVFGGNGARIDAKSVGAALQTVHIFAPASPRRARADHKSIPIMGTVNSASSVVQAMAREANTASAS